MDKKIRSDIRNIAIIAHVDHGKTTLVDELLQQSGTIKETDDRIMDSNAIEKERGITILAKNTGIKYKDKFINIVDTPGHADFGGEVERTLQMVEGFILLVDAAEGVLPGTRFVLQKALNLNLKPIVVINKIDRKDAQIEATESQIHDLFLDLATNENQLDFPVLYGSSRDGYVSTDSTQRSGNMIPLFEAILEYISPPEEQTSEGLQFLTTCLDSSDYLGLIAIGRIFSGEMTVGMSFISCLDNKVSKPSKITKIYKFEGLNRLEVDKAKFGDIVAVTGFSDPIKINTTLCNVDKPLPCKYVAIDEPTLVMYLSVNNSPFNGREGKLLTSRQIKERLEKELETNVALRVEPTDSPESFKLSGRGQLHLGILVENMRREGFELQLSAPEVIYKTINGAKHEPIENLILDIQEIHQGIIMESLGSRKAELTNISPSGEGRIKMEFAIPSRALIGFRSQFLTDTRGTGLLNVSFKGYEPYKGDIPTRNKGAIVTMEPGKITTYALDNLQSRGEFFVKPGQEVYEGMVIGENSREVDLEVNPCKTKKLTNMRASGTDEAAQIGAVRVMNLEKCMEWIRPDELIEVTPESIRLRKKILKAGMRKRSS
ncbi:GTP-binding protein TypA [candidate division TM6 bacterium RIFCSPHIGHO2_12_FULL_36_22]|nr:MAG: GTP-binding protein TypA [candidate division TM6 bacterium RIFCSPHIGHO2_12_FULL_36_22]